MPRRVSVPRADDLFRPTLQGVPDEAAEAAEAAVASTEAEGQDDTEVPARRPSGRVRHDEKMTVYVTSDELLDIEHARLSLRATQGLAVDRGRLIREAVAIVLADLDAHGDQSALVRRLTQQ